jgi:hypothetical protein
MGIRIIQLSKATESLAAYIQDLHGGPHRGYGPGTGYRRGNLRK